MTTEKTTYEGSCHCGKVAFVVRSPEIVAGLQCTCSICIRKNAIMSKHYVEPKDFQLLRGKDDLSIYHWNDKDVNHYFCRHCGIYPFHDSIYEPGKYRINLGCLDDVDPRGLEIDIFDGKNLL